MVYHNIYFDSYGIVFLYRKLLREDSSSSLLSRFHCRSGLAARYPGPPPRMAPGPSRDPPTSSKLPAALDRTCHGPSTHSTASLPSSSSFPSFTVPPNPSIAHSPRVDPVGSSLDRPSSVLQFNLPFPSPTQPIPSRPPFFPPSASSTPRPHCVPPIAPLAPSPFTLAAARSLPPTPFPPCNHSSNASFPPCPRNACAGESRPIPAPISRPQQLPAPIEDPRQAVFSPVGQGTARLPVPPHTGPTVPSFAPSPCAPVRFAVSPRIFSLWKIRQDVGCLTNFLSSDDFRQSRVLLSYLPVLIDVLDRNGTTADFNEISRLATLAPPSSSRL